MRRQGFTMIELLVVIAIISMLIAIAQPILSVSASRTYEHQCESHLQQVGMAMTAYAQDNGSFPPRLSSVDSILQNRELLRCPKTSRLYYYARPKPDAARDTIVAACVNPHKYQGRMPHRFGTTSLALTASGSVKRLIR